MSPSLAKIVGVILLIATIGVVSCQALSEAPMMDTPVMPAPSHAAPR